MIRNSFYIDFEFSSLNNISKICNSSSEDCIFGNNIIDGHPNQLFSSEKTDDIRIKLRYNISK